MVRIGGKTSAGVPPALFYFSSFFVAWVERSETQGAAIKPRCRSRISLRSIRATCYLLLAHTLKQSSRNCKKSPALTAYASLSQPQAPLSALFRRRAHTLPPHRRLPNPHSPSRTASIPLPRFPPLQASDAGRRHKSHLISCGRHPKPFTIPAVSTCSKNPLPNAGRNKTSLIATTADAGSREPNPLIPGKGRATIILCRYGKANKGKACDAYSTKSAAAVQSIEAALLSFACRYGGE